MIPFETVGITNAGRTCYLNAVVQLYCQDGGIRKDIIRHPLSCSEVRCLWCIMRDLVMSVLLTCSTSKIEPRRLINWIRSKGASYDLFVDESCDAHDFIMAINKEINIVSTDRVQSSECLCLGCHNTSKSSQEMHKEFEIFVDKERELSVSEYLQGFISETNEAFICDECGNVGGQVNLILHSPPETVLIYFKRFYNEEKNCTPVILDDELELQVFEADSVKYEMLGCIQHIGLTLDDGHYVTFLRSESDWVLKNDELTSRENVLQGETLIAIYSRRKNTTINFSDASNGNEPQLSSETSVGDFEKGFNANDGQIKYCPACPTKCDPVINLRRHALFHHPNASIRQLGFFQCFTCPATFVTLFDLNFHLSLVHKSTFFLKCKFCSHIFKTIDSVKVHYIEKHKVLLKPYQFFDNVESDSEYSTTVCYECGLDMLLFSDLLTHCLKEHSSTVHVTSYLQRRKRTIHICEICFEEFTVLRLLREHYEMEHADSSVIQKDVFRCDQEGCNMLFKHQQQLYHHKRDVHNVKPLPLISKRIKLADIQGDNSPSSSLKEFVPKKEVLSDEEIELLDEDLHNSDPDDDAAAESENLRLTSYSIIIDSYRSIGRHINNYYDKTDLRRETVISKLKADKTCSVCSEVCDDIFLHHAEKHGWKRLNESNTHLLLLDSYLVTQSRCRTCKIRFRDNNEQEMHKELHLRYEEMKEKLFDVKWGTTRVRLPKIQPNTTRLDLSIMAVGLCVSSWMYVRKKMVVCSMLVSTWLQEKTKRNGLKELFERVKKPVCIPFKIYIEHDLQLSRLLNIDNAATCDVYKQILYDPVIDDDYDGISSLENIFGMYHFLVQPYIAMYPETLIKFQSCKTVPPHVFIEQYIHLIDQDKLCEHMDALLRRQTSFVCGEVSACKGKDCMSLLHLECFELIRKGSVIDKQKAFNVYNNDILRLTPMEWDHTLTFQSNPETIQDYREQLELRRKLYTKFFVYIFIPTKEGEGFPIRRFNRRRVEQGFDFGLYVGYSRAPFLPSYNVLQSDEDHGGTMLTLACRKYGFNTIHECKRLPFDSYIEARKSEAAIQLLLTLYEKVEIGKGSLILINKRIEWSYVSELDLKTMKGIVYLSGRRVDLFDSNLKIRLDIAGIPYNIENPPFYPLCGPRTLWSIDEIEID